MCGIAGSWPFDDVILTRIVGDDGEPTEWVEIVGRRNGQELTVRIVYAELWKQMEDHMRFRHGKSLDDPDTFGELEHATIRAAVAFLMD